MSDTSGSPSDPFAATEAAALVETTPVVCDPALVETTPASGARAPAAPTGPTPGRVIGRRFEVLGRVGAGGMGMVYRAHDRALDQVVAVKLLHPSLARDAKLLERFRQEVRLARLITHPAVCRLHDLEEADGQRFLTMEFIDGQTLAQRLAHDERPSADEAMRIGRGIAAGLGAAHAQGVLHLDLKPGNVMLTRAGRVVVMDFGVSRLLGPGLDTGLDSLVGTVAYMAPEQLAGQELDRRTDVYALGLVLYEMVCGEVPLRGASRSETALQRLDHEAPDPRRRCPDVPERLRRVIRRCLQRDPQQRYVNADDVWRDLGHGQAVSLVDLTTPLVSRDAPRRRTRRALLALLGAVLLAAAIAGALHLGAPTRPTQVGLIAVLAAEQEAAVAPMPASAPSSHRPPPRRRRAAQRLVAQELRELGLAATAADSAGASQATARVRLARAGDEQLIEVELVDPAAHVIRRGRGRTLAAASAMVAHALAAVVRTPPPPRDPRDAVRAGTRSKEALRELELGRVAVRQRDRSRAIAHATRASRADPTLPLPHVLLAATEEPFTEKSRAHLRRARDLARARNDAQSRLALALARWEVDGDDAGALRALAALNAADPDDADVAYCYADALGDAWKTEQANAILERLLEATPDHVNAMLRLFDMRVTRREVDQLLRDGARLVDRAPEQPHAAIFYGRALLAAGQLERALAAFGDALELDPDHAVALKYRARARLHRGDLLGARAAARRLAVGDARARAEGLRILGVSSLFEGRFATALRHLEDALRDSRDEPYELFYVHKLEVLTLEDLGDYAAAATAAKRWEDAARQAHFWQQAAYARQRQDVQRLRQALLTRDEFQRLLPAYLDELKARTGEDVIGGQGPKLEARHAFAVEDYRGALAAALRDEAAVADTQFLIGECYAHLGQHELAAQRFRRILTHPDEEPLPTILVRARLRLADALTALGRADEARPLYREFVAAWRLADRPLPEVERARQLAQRGPAATR